MSASRSTSTFCTGDFEMTKAKKSAAAGKKTGSKEKSTHKKAPAGAVGLRVRMYRVGFGDFFLVIVPKPAGGDAYILIDCGVFKGTSGTGDIGSIEEAVQDLFETTGGKLALVIMTHRHADHIAGFNKAAKVFQNFEASMVWMPFWEQFNDAKDSPMKLQADIEQLALQLAMQFRGRRDEQAEQALDQLSNATGIDFSATSTKPRKLIGNAAALDLLKNHLGKNGKNVRYYAAGDVPELPPELEGLSARILGPPPKEAKAFMKLEDLKKGVGQYLDSNSSDDNSSVGLQPFRPQWHTDPSRAYPKTDTTGKPLNYEEVVKDVASAQPDLLVTAARKIDNFLNNQSLVVLFKFGDKNLLFAGDAQAGNWEHWLYKIGAPVSDPTKAGPITEESQQILQTVDFYKMGHHGSTNATPIQVVEIIGKARTDAGLVAMCSTEPGVYGNPDPAKGTEVPRGPLLSALSDKCTLIRSDAFAIKTKSVGVISASEKVSAPPPPKFGKLTAGDLFVEYSF
jgi:hypothetical protein